MKYRVCELCNGEATVYCESDSAFLCWKCDAKVHEANFLVARHVRRTVCSKCKGFDGNHISGVGFRPRSICRSCLPESGCDDLDYSRSSSSSSAESFAAAPWKIDFDQQRLEKKTCSTSETEVSSNESSFPTKFPGDDDDSTKKKKKKKKKKKTLLRSPPGPKKVDVKTEGILVNWCRKLGLKNGCYVPLASTALGVCLRKLTVLPFRVSLASSLWLSWKLCVGSSASTCQNLKRLEEISGVPAKLILLAESKLSRFLKMEKSQLHQEGWAECSV